MNIVHRRKKPTTIRHLKLLQKSLLKTIADLLSCCFTVAQMYREIP